MSTTVTTTTVTTLAVVSFAAISILVLLALLVQKEILGSLESPRAQRLSKALNGAIIPLVLIFLVTVVLRVSEALR